jgi:hypothetical protein
MLLLLMDEIQALPAYDTEPVWVQAGLNVKKKLEKAPVAGSAA